MERTPSRQPNARDIDLERGTYSDSVSPSDTSTYSQSSTYLPSFCEVTTRKTAHDEKTASRDPIVSQAQGRETTKDPAEQDFELPLQPGSRVYRWLRWHFFSTYRRLFTLVFVANLTILVTFVIRTVSGRRGLTYYSTLTSTSANLLLSILIRQEHIVNFLYRISTAVSPNAPLLLRRCIAKIYGYGGLHSGCALGAVFWYITFTCLATYHAFRPPSVEPAILVLTYVNIVLLLAITAFSHPLLRSCIHNWFEVTHRFAGWTVVAIFWAQTIVMARTDGQAAQQSLGRQLLIIPTFWCLIIITLCIAYPWARLRKQPVTAEPLSEHAIRLHFRDIKVDMCQAIRIGDQPLKETHAFAVIGRKPESQVADWWSSARNVASHGMEKLSKQACPHCSHCRKAVTRYEAQQPPNQRGASVVISRAGDWTSRIIANPPSHLYIRGTPTYGVLRIATLFSPVLIVATGSGIGPCLSLFNRRPNLNCRILWSTPNPLETYGKDIVTDVRRAHREAIIVDTRREGRPDLVRMAFAMYKKFRCEAVVLISNPKVTREVVYGLETRGVPAFAPIFDS